MRKTIHLFIRNYTMFFILLVSLTAEVFLFNLSFWKTLGCQSQTISVCASGITDENGCFSTDKFRIDGPVKNVSVHLDELIGTDRATATIYISDKGNAYEYATPSYTIVPGTDKSGYTNIYTYGDVTDIRVAIQVDSGARAVIDNILVNVTAPFVFKFLRFAIVFALLSLMYAVMADTFIHRIYCGRNNKKQILVTTLCIFLFLLLGYQLTTSNPKCMGSLGDHHTQYQELAHSLDAGTVVLQRDIDPRLLEKENPYDTIALEVEQIHFHMDCAFFNGEYYVYFGPVPEFLLYYPYYKLTEKNLPNYVAFYAFYATFIVGVFGIVWELIHKFTKKFPFYLYILLSAAVCFFPNYVFMAGRPDLYNIPIMAGTAFSICGIWLWMRGLAFEKGKSMHYALGSLCMALVAGCRPQLLLYSAVAIPLFFHETVLERNLFSKKKLRDTLCFILPYVFVACFVFWYNAARFGNGFDFGATYSLTSNDMNTRGFNLSRLAHGLFSYLFQPPVIDASYPFLRSSNLQTNYMGRNITEFMYGGIFAVNPLLWILPYAVLLGGHKKMNRLSKWLTAILAAAGFIIVCFDINGAGNLQRYVADMVPGFLLAAIIIWMVVLDCADEQSSYPNRARLITLFTICGLAFAFLTFIAKGDSICLFNNNAQLFYTIESYFKF